MHLCRGWLHREGAAGSGVGNIEVAQFIYLLLHNPKLGDVIDTITSKAVLILGRCTGERKKVLDPHREELRKRNYLPILFDFDKPAERDLTETISLLARMARRCRPRSPIGTRAASPARRKRRVHVRALQALSVGSKNPPL